MRIVVSLTTIPTREHSLLKTIKSIQSGTVLPDIIYVNIPVKYVRFKEQFDPDVKKDLQSMKGVQVNDIQEERGSLDKIIPILKLEQDPDTCIVIVDDDASYSSRFIEGLVTGYSQYQTVVGYSGIAYPETAIRQTGQLRYILIQGHGQMTEILEGSFGVLFPRRVFNNFLDFEPMTAENTKMYLSDDYVFSKYLDTQGVIKRIVWYPWAGRKGDDWKTVVAWNENSQTYSLSSLGNLERYLTVKL
jgi:hypothetical protein